MDGRVDGGELFVRTVKRHGIDVMYTLHGGHLDAIFQACLDHGIKLIDVRHEAAAGHAAEAYARLTSRPGIALITAGPGFTNVITAVTNAYLDCMPVLFIAGAPPLRDAEINPLQGGFNQVAMVAPVTKWAHQITHTHQIPALVDQALKIARTGRPGPVFLEIPIDVLFSQVNEAAVRLSETALALAPPSPDPGAVSRAIALLSEAERPIILAGGGAMLSQCGADLTAFAERTGIPVFTNNKAHGLIAGDHPLAGRAFGNLAVLADSPFKRPDAALVLGARFGLYTGGITDRLLPFNMRFIHVDMDARELGRLRDTEVPIVADCGAALRALRAAADSRAWPARAEWQGMVRAVRDAHIAKFADASRDDSAPIHPYRAAEVIAEFVTPDTVVATDGGEAKSWIEMVTSFPSGSRYLSLGYLGCLGVGMPFAVGAQSIRPESRVICVTGDGAAGLNIQEFDTMVRHKLPVLTIVFNNHSWGMSAHAQDIVYGANRRVVSDLASTDYSSVATGFGCVGENVTRLSELRPAIVRALESGRPACINVMIDYAAVSPYTLGMLGNWQSENEIVLPYYDNIKL